MFSLKKYLGTTLAALLVFIGLYLWWQAGNRWLLWILLGATLGIEALIYHWQNQGRKDYWRKLSLLILTFLSLVLLMSVVEEVKINWLLNIIGPIGIIPLFLLPEEENIPPHQRKPWRRFLTIILTWDSFVLLTFLFALNVFSVPVPFWLGGLVVSLIIGLITQEIWRLYFNWPREKFLLWSLLLSLLLWELVWIIQLLPLGYLSAGMFAVWPWYLAQLFVRFHLSPEDIVWRRQTAFLITNLVLYVGLLLFFVKWI